MISPTPGSFDLARKRFRDSADSPSGETQNPASSAFRRAISARSLPADPASNGRPAGRGGTASSSSRVSRKRSAGVESRPISTSNSTSSVPRLSISIFPRPTKWSRRAWRCAWQFQPFRQ